MNLNVNPIIYSPENVVQIGLYQTRESLLDTELYAHFLYNIENQFRKSRFYKDYKANIYSRGIDFDQQMRNITSEMTDCELHHHLPTLKDAAICIIEYYTHTIGQVCTFDVIQCLENCHRNNMMGVIMLTTTNHQSFHADPSAFISISQLYGNPFEFISKFGKYATLNIAYNWLLQFKQEDQNENATYWPLLAKAREELLTWSNEGAYQY